MSGQQALCWWSGEVKPSGNENAIRSGCSGDTYDSCPVPAFPLLNTQRRSKILFCSTSINFIMFYYIYNCLKYTYIKSVIVSSLTMVPIADNCLFGCLTNWIKLLDEIFIKSLTLRNNFIFTYDKLKSCIFTLRIRTRKAWGSSQQTFTFSYQLKWGCTLIEIMKLLEISFKRNYLFGGLRSPSCVCELLKKLITRSFKFMFCTVT